jgi:hypothetical protein
MLHTLQALFITYWYIVVPLLVLLFLLIPVVVHWEKVRYSLMLSRLHFPLFGKIKSWAGQSQEQDPESHFLTAEKNLCSAYYHYYDRHNKDGQYFQKCEDYLMKASEDDRREKGMGLWALVTTLMVIEASAFGYALSPYALTLATPNTALAGAFGIGLVISIIALMLSELTGRQLYLNHMVGQMMAYATMRKKGEDGDFIKKKLINIDSTYSDNELPAYQQMLNRIKVTYNKQRPSKSFGITAAYGVFIVILAVAAFWVRAETLQAQEAELISNPPAISAQANDFPSSTNDFPITDDMKALGNDSKAKSAQDQIDSMHRASMITFGVLSALFVFIQFTSTYLAYSRGFVGSKSKEAWEQTVGFSNADEYVSYHRRVASSIAVDAQQALSTLQALLSSQFHISGTDNNEKESNKHTRTFERFVQFERSKKSTNFSVTPPTQAAVLATVAEAEIVPKPVVQTPKAAGFDPHAWGKLTGYEEEDLAYVAGKKGVDEALIRRAYRLQMLDEQES